MRVLVLEPAHVPFYNSFRRYGVNVAEAGEASGRFAAHRLDAPALSRKPWLRRGEAAREIRDFAEAAIPPHDVVHMVENGLAHHRTRFETPVVVTHHDLMRSVQFRPGIPNPLEAIRERNLRALWKYRSLRRDQASIRHQFRADLVIAVTKRMGDELATLPRAENARIRVVYNAIGRHIGRFPDAEAWLSARGVALPPRPRVLMVGHAGPYKNPFATVAALALPRLRGATLVRAGREMTAAERARVATQGVPMVELGTIDDATLARVYNACDVLVQPSLWEGFGIPVVEAFASGLPVVTSDGGALPEVVDGAGVVVPGIATAQPAPSAVAAFAEAIARTIEDPAHAQELRERGLERAKRFSAARIGAELADAYEEARANHRARRTGR